MGSRRVEAEDGEGLLVGEQQVGGLGPKVAHPHWDPGTRQINHFDQIRFDRANGDLWRVPG